MRKNKDNRGLHPNSQRNLRLGSLSRNQNKERHNFTILPETYNWLHQHESASEKIDELVRLLRDGELIPKDKLPSTSERTSELEAEVRQLKKQLEKQKSLNKKVISILSKSLPLPANAAGAIKEEILKALEVILKIKFPLEERRKTYKPILEQIMKALSELE